MSETKMMRQGDVLFIQRESLPANVQQEKRDSRNRAVFAEGEVTGHAHAVETQTGEIYRNPQDGSRWFEAWQESRVVHEEHGTITLPGETVWEIVGQNRLDILSRLQRRVLD
jgi:hypothetical protein